MDSVAVDSLLIALGNVSTSCNVLSGTLWAFAGVLLFLVCGYLFIRYTLRG